MPLPSISSFHPFGQPPLDADLFGPPAQSPQQSRCPPQPVICHDKTVGDQQSDFGLVPHDPVARYHFFQKILAVLPPTQRHPPSIASRKIAEMVGVPHEDVYLHLTVLSASGLRKQVGRLFRRFPDASLEIFRPFQGQRGQSERERERVLRTVAATVAQILSKPSADVHAITSELAALAHKTSPRTQGPTNA
jgi:hypothetical protein